MFTILAKLKQNFISSGKAREALRITRKKLIIISFLIYSVLILTIYVKSYHANDKAEVKGISNIKNNPTVTRVPSPTTTPSPSPTITPTPQAPTNTPAVTSPTP